MTNQEIEEVCRKFYIKNYTINDDGTIDVNDSVSFYRMSFHELPLKFNKVSGYFRCVECSIFDLKGFPNYVGASCEITGSKFLTSLVGCPSYIGSNFNCHENQLTSLVGGPKEVGGYFNCYDNKLTDLQGSPDKVGGYFYCSVNKLTSLIGCTKNIGMSFDCRDNLLTSLVGGPDQVGGVYHCGYNDISDLKGLGKFNERFRCDDNPIGSIFNNVENDFTYAFQVYQVINGGEINLKRLKYVMNVFDLPINIEKIEKHYKLV